jgi:ATP-dependent 26S proteasome regulatory subunit
MEQSAPYTFLIYIKKCCRFEKQDGVVLMATTRNLKQIDEALQRPGRMDRVFHLQRPTQAEREKILRTAAKETMDNELIDFVDWIKVIAQSVSWVIYINIQVIIEISELVSIGYRQVC